MHRIYFDTNEEAADEEGTYYRLDIPGTLKDIEPIAKDLREGVRVVIYMGDELEQEAILKFDKKWNRWLACPIDGTLKYYPRNRW